MLAFYMHSLTSSFLIFEGSRVESMHVRIRCCFLLLAIGLGVYQQIDREQRQTVETGYLNTLFNVYILPNYCLLTLCNLQCK